MAIASEAGNASVSRNDRRGGTSRVLGALQFGIMMGTLGTWLRVAGRSQPHSGLCVPEVDGD